MVSSKSLSALLGVALAAVQSTLAAKLVDAPPQELLSYTPFGGKNASILKSPADWNRNTFPIPVHSHNDYERTVPIFEALSYGALSMESDVWLNPDDGKLYVGHDPYSLTRERTFQALTIEPLVKAIEQANRANILQSQSEEAQFFANLQNTVRTNTSNAWNGYYSLGVGSSAPLQLLVDIKTDGNATWPVLVQELEPLRKRGWLTSYENGKINPGPVLVIGTGNTPIHQVAPLHKRDYFFDGPLGKLDTPTVINGTSYEWNSTLSPIASGSFRVICGEYDGLDEASDAVKQNISAPIQQAHAKGIKSRYWDSPQWPIFARHRINHLMLAAKSDFIGSDDLADIARW
ncbi:hypothetical protein BCV70DRAFT_205939 [Testicularia cyperi]|uniref:Altered inheritance of mitochondria protein 6 n=1 Tax=Testicularia cyperi TaxID=1882483 RepID=A0A317XQC4_9BASI|nr:hypothetical protein BCV70DRAFT_205939 [Testicularia cyperi]